MSTKTCTQCGQLKELTEFSARKRSKDGRQSACKECNRAYCRENAARIRDRNQQVRRERGDALRAREREYRAQNIAKRRAYTQKNAEKIRAQSREWRLRNPQRVLEQNSLKRARKRNAAHAPYSRAEIFARWGGTCAYCDAPAEHLDHVIALALGGADAAHNLLPACADCNLSKGSRTLGAWVASWGAP